MLKWVGGKTWILDRLTPLLDAPILVDLFTGGFSVSLHALSLGKSVIANDINTALMSFYSGYYRGNATHVDLGYGLFDIIDSEVYYELRGGFNDYLSDKDYVSYVQYSINEGFLFGLTLGQLLLALNKSCFNGLYRVNKKGLFNTPYGKRNKTFFELRDDRIYSQFDPNRVKLSNRDYRSVDIPTDSIVFADPPYAGTFTQYDSDGWTYDDSRKLIEYLSDYKSIITVNYSEMHLEMLRSCGFHATILEAPRRINKKSDNTAMEILAYNYDPIIRD